MRNQFELCKPLSVRQVAMAALAEGDQSPHSKAHASVALWQPARASKMGCAAALCRSLADGRRLGTACLVSTTFDRALILTENILRMTLSLAPSVQFTAPPRQFGRSIL